MVTEEAMPPIGLSLTRSRATASSSRAFSEGPPGINQLFRSFGFFQTGAPAGLTSKAKCFGPGEDLPLRKGARRRRERLHGGQGDAAEALRSPPRPEITAPCSASPRRQPRDTRSPFLPTCPPGGARGKAIPWVRSTAFHPHQHHPPAFLPPLPRLLFVSAPARVLHQLSPDGAGKERE